MFILSQVRSLISMISASLPVMKPHYRNLPLPQKVPQKLLYTQLGIVKIAFLPCSERKEMELQSWKKRNGQTAKYARK